MEVLMLKAHTMVMIERKENVKEVFRTTLSLMNSWSGTSADSKKVTTSMIHCTWLG